MSKGLRDLQSKVIRFRDERDWAQFHTLHHLTTALAIEAAELQEQLLWRTDEQAQQQLLNPAKREAFEDEMADVLAYLLCLCEQTQTDLTQALERKLQKNAAKYPVERVKGCADKYTEYLKHRK